MGKTKFRRVKGEDGECTPFRVFLIHGHSRVWEEVKAFIEKTLHFEVIVSIEEFEGKTIIQKIRERVWHDCDCAVAILSPDDVQRDRTRTARPNVLFELGYCMGFFDYRYWEDDDIHPVIMIVENTTKIPSDLEGIERIRYSAGSGISAEFDTLKQALNRIYTQVKEYFDSE